MIIRDRRVPGVSGDVHHLTPLQQVWRQELEGKVGLDYSASCQVVGVLKRLIKHLAKLLVIRAHSEWSEELSVDETVRLQEGTSDHLGDLRPLNIHLIDQSPDQLYGPGGASLGVAHYEDIVVSQLEIGNPLTSLENSIIPEN